MDGIGGVERNEIGDGFVTVIGTPQGDCLLSVFVKLQQAEAILINILKVLKSSPMLSSKERKIKHVNND